MHADSFYRVYYNLPQFDFNKIRQETWTDCFKHDDTTLAILFALCGFDYRVWKDNPDVNDRCKKGAFLHGVKDNYNYVREGKNISEHHKECSLQNQQFNNKLLLAQ